MKHTSPYNQNQRRTARMLLTVWLLTSCNPGITLAAPEPEGAMVPITSTSPCVLALPSVDAELAMDTTPMLLHHRAPGLLSRALDKLARPFSRSRQQVAPRTQPGPIAEGAGQGSGGHCQPSYPYPRGAPKTARRPRQQDPLRSS